MDHQSDDDDEDQNDDLINIVDRWESRERPARCCDSDEHGHASAKYPEG